MKRDLRRAGVNSQEKKIVAVNRQRLREITRKAKATDDVDPTPQWSNWKKEKHINVTVKGNVVN